MPNHRAPQEAKLPYQWYQGTASALGDVGPDILPWHTLEPSTLAKFQKYLCKLQPIAALNHVHNRPPVESLEKSKPQGPLARLLVEPCPVKAGGIGQQIGPLRSQSDTLVQIPSVLYRPFTFYLLDTWQPPTEDSNIVVKYAIAQFLDQTRIYIENTRVHASLLCCMSMYLAVLVHGKKLQPKIKSIPKYIYKAHSKLASAIANLIISSPLSSQLSFRSLAYLVNSQVGGECSRVLDFCAQVLLARQAEPMDPNHLENFLFGFSRNYYDNHLLYKDLARRVQLVDSHDLKMIENFKCSLERIGELQLISSS
ncbi:ADP-glucose pyrophosphorylase [Babesia duncani]|uniref:ADP-glucose pyrophosphorylase n=1 Tax=Babesia duncani TaxID=323732 RepID=A0AAD9PPE1_9APIC|nr:ADP-glucose pyrophosphorylase [Babesia duncani]